MSPLETTEETLDMAFRNDRGDTRYGIHVRVLDPVPMTALVGVIATAFCLVLFILFCVAYTFKTRKCCFKHKGPAFERDNNFRIYPNDNYIVSRHLITMETISN